VKQQGQQELIGLTDDGGSMPVKRRVAARSGACVVSPTEGLTASGEMSTARQFLSTDLPEHELNRSSGVTHAECIERV